MEVDVATNMGVKTSIQEFLKLEHDTEPLVMGVQWHASLVGEHSTRLVNMDTFGQPMTISLEATEDKAEEDSNLDDANLDVYLGGSEEAPETYNQFSGPRRAQVNCQSTWANPVPAL